MQSGEFDKAAVSYRKAIDIYMKLREEHPGPGYSYIDDDIAMANVLLRTALDHSVTGNPLPVPDEASGPRAPVRPIPR